MAHFAKLGKDKVIISGVGEVHVVESVIVLNNEDCIDKEIESEQAGKDFIKQHIYPDDLYIQTSYNGKVRKNYAYIGGYYSEELDAFIAPKPENNPVDKLFVELKGDWILNKSTALWEFHTAL